MRELNTLQVNIDSTFERFCPFPIGYIYQSTNSTSPADLYGGTWAALTDGRFLQPSSSWNSTGGNSTHAHWTTFGYGYAEDRMYAGDYSNSDNQNSRTKNGKHYPVDGKTTSPYVGLYRENTTYNASSLPPYRTCYAWYRTA